MSIVVATVTDGVVVGPVSPSVVMGIGRLAEVKVIVAPEPVPVKVSKIKPRTKRA